MQQRGAFFGIGLTDLLEAILAIYESQNVRPGKEVQKAWLLEVPP